MTSSPLHRLLARARAALAARTGRLASRAPVVVLALVATAAVAALAGVLLPAARTQAQDAALPQLAPVAPAQQQATPQPTTHKVGAGETLSEIAKLYGFSVEQLLRVNGISDANSIRVGQVIRLPQVDRPVGVTIHVIVAGDTLGGIARQYGVDLNELMEANDISNANDITSGQELVIPAAGAAAAAAPATVAPALATVAPAVSPVAPTLAPAATAASPAVPTLAAIVIVGGQSSGEPTLAAPSLAVQAPAPATVAPAIQPTAAPLLATAEPLAAATAPPAAGAEEVPQAATLSHTVKPGETASAIAKRYGVPLRDLLRANGIANADLLRSGAELVIPGPALEAAVATAEAVVTVAPAEQAAASAEVAMSAQADLAPEIAHTVSGDLGLPERPATSLNRTYTVGSGDTLGRIASRQGVDAEALRVLNGLPASPQLVAGDTLLLPATDSELLVRTPDNVYTVQSGDSLSAIAVAQGVDLGALMAVNEINNANSLRAGQELVVPGRTVHGAGPLLRVGPAPSGYYYYTVQAGDTLSELADGLNTTKTALMDYNNLSDESVIFSGMELRIPYGAPQLPKRTPPVPVSGNSFLISLSRQQCWVLTGTQVRYAWNCSTGRADRRTKTGSFAVQSKIDMAQSNVWRLDMPYWLGIYDVGRVENGIHGLPIDWDTGRKIWTRLIGQPATFGCAMLGDENAETLFNLAYLGMPVTIVQ